MRYKELGKDHIKIPVIGQGCMGIGGYFSKDLREDDRQVRALRFGIELGMTLIDTAEVYGNGHSEELVGKAIQGMRDKVFVATKFSPEHNSYDDVLSSAEGSLRRLKTDYIDLYQIHWPNPNIPIDETMKAMDKLLRDGKIRYVGVSNFSIRELKEAEAAFSGSAIASVQTEYNLFDRSIEDDILPYCQKKNIITIAYSPLDQGKICSGSEKTKVFEKIAEKYSGPLPGIPTTRFPAVDSAISTNP